MNAGDIAFPHIGIYLQNVPKNFSVFGYVVALYGVIIALGMVAGVAIAVWLAKKHDVDPDIIWDFATYGIIFGVVGARVYYVAFSWDQYKDDLLSIFNIRNGGGAIYGSVIAAFLTLFIYSRVKKVSYLTIADICVPGLALGQAIGRWGNFCNREAFGQYTDGLLAMRLPVEAVRSWDISEQIRAHIAEGTNYIQVHPTFLYESLWNFILVALLVLLWEYRKFDGQISLAYLGGYGLGRAWIEGLRTDQLHIPGTNLAVSQMLAILLVVFAVTTTCIALSRKKKQQEL